MPNGAEVSLPHLLADCAVSIRRSFAEHVPLYLCSLSFGFVAAALVAFYHLPFPLAPAVYLLGVAVSCLAFVAKLLVVAGGCAALKTLWRMYREDRPDHPLSIMSKRVVASALAGGRVGNMFHGLLAFVPMMIMFAALKPDIARIRPFMWDETFMQLGTWMGFGRHLWQVLQPVFGYPPITVFLSVAYGLWFPLMFGCFLWQAARPVNDITRSLFLLSFAFAWFFGGFVLATIFSSAGPAFYSHIVSGPSPYAPLLHYLRETSRYWPVWTVSVQDALWHSYVSGTGDVEGISAMPSMHLIVATLMALLAWRTNRALGVAFTLFAFIILIGSIMLGWHYSADGLAGVALAFVFWGAAGKVTQKWGADRARSVEEQPMLAVPALSET
jgi:hypothetical protein